jgi:Recombination endonuclease VII
MHRDPEQRREYARRYREANKEKLREYKRQWRAASPQKGRDEYARYHAANRDNELQRKRLFNEQNRERLKEEARQWRALNPERSREVQRKFRERNTGKLRLAGMVHIHGPLYPVVFAQMWQAQDGRCYLCRRALDRSKVHMDHDHRCCPSDASCGLCRRGLACMACNVLIGRADDDPQRLRLIADNLEIALKEVDARLTEKPEQQALGLND